MMSDMNSRRVDQSALLTQKRNLVVCICVNADANATLGGSVANDIRNVINQCTTGGDCSNSATAVVYPVVHTYADLVSASNRLAHDCSQDKGACSVLLYISGHGYQKREENKAALVQTTSSAPEEVLRENLTFPSSSSYFSSPISKEEDGMDEYICLTGNKHVLDDELKDKFYNVWKNYSNKRCFNCSSDADTSLFPAFVAIVDTCHSGTMLDFENLVPHQVNPVVSKYSEQKSYRSLCISSCRDSGTAACDIGQTSGFGGAMTVHLLDCGIFGKLTRDLAACANGKTNGIDGKSLFEYLNYTHVALQTAYCQRIQVTTEDAQ